MEADHDCDMPPSDLFDEFDEQRREDMGLNDEDVCEYDEDDYWFDDEDEEWY